MEENRRTSSGNQARRTAQGSRAAGAGAGRSQAQLKSSAARRRRRRARRRRAMILRACFIVVLLALIGVAAACIMNKNTITFSIADGETINTEYGQEASLPEVTATVTGTLFNKNGKTIGVTEAGDVDCNTLGDYPITYTAKYHATTATVTCNVHVADTTAPVITLVHDDNYYTATGMPYQEEGYSAVDNFDGDITANVTSTEENGVVTYTVTDSNGNVGTATREIQYSDNIVYLTFDDGPGQYTDQLLDTLAKYNVKVTFFVTNQFPKYLDCLTREAQEGHTVAVHSYTHDFATMYASDEAFWADINQMADVIKEKTGTTPDLFRFPGGSGNSASRKYCEGIMTALVSECEEHGYQYVDWNVNSGDADGVTDPNEVAANIIAGIQSHGVSIVLQHDIKSYSVEAVEQVIQWGLANGYVFLPLTSSSWLYHGSTIRN